MKKKHSRSNKGFSSIQLNWDVVRSFISDVKVKDNAHIGTSVTAFVPSNNSVITENKESTISEEISAPIEKAFVDRNNSSKDECVMSLKPTDPVQEREKENLIDIVEELVSCAKVKKDLRIATIARVHCMYDDKYETFWFTNQLICN